jgi:putative Mg2+ transporter-C (MgtC) family protein
MNDWWTQIWEGARADFTNLPDLAATTRLIVRLLSAAILGGLLGFERAEKGKPAGLRTHMLVALGAALFVMVAEQYGMATADLSRVIQGILTGIGFIGAGAILKITDQVHVRGLTTRASGWPPPSAWPPAWGRQPWRYWVPP